jgi:hypothetical protein
LLVAEETDWTSKMVCWNDQEFNIGSIRLKRVSSFQQTLIQAISSIEILQFPEIKLSLVVGIY